VSRRPSSSLTDGEFRIMRALWELQRATVTEIIERMHDQGVDVPSYNSVLTLLGILERKGYVAHTKDGRRAYVFEPKVDRGVVRKSALASLLARFFDGSPTQLILDLMGHERFDPKELNRLRKLLEQSRSREVKSAARRRP
jgi:BlaI family transcriptional regulator, penicillinase repressor